MSDILNGHDKENKQAEELQKRELERHLNDLRCVLKSPEGRRFVWWLLCFAGVYRSPLAGTVESVWVNAGKQLIGLQLIDDIHKVDPKAMYQMQHEYDTLRKQEEKL